MKTTEGYKVAGLGRAFNVKAFDFNQYSGRVRVVKGDPYFDDYARWDLEGHAIDHEYGDIILTKGNKK